MEVIGILTQLAVVLCSSEKLHKHTGREFMQHGQHSITALQP